MFNFYDYGSVLWGQLNEWIIHGVSAGQRSGNKLFTTRSVSAYGYYYWLPCMVYRVTLFAIVDLRRLLPNEWIRRPWTLEAWIAEYYYYLLYAIVYCLIVGCTIWWSPATTLVCMCIVSHKRKGEYNIWHALLHIINVFVSTYAPNIPAQSPAVENIANIRHNFIHSPLKFIPEMQRRIQLRLAGGGVNRKWPNRK